MDIDGEVVDHYFGNSVSLSYNGLIVAIGASLSDRNGTNSGCFQIFEFFDSTSSWSQVGSALYGSAGDYFGGAVSLFSDGLVLAVGAPKDLGYAQVYQRIDDTWTQLGDDLQGTNQFGSFGAAVAISADASKVAVGDHEINNGTVYLYNFHVPVPPGWYIGICIKPDGSDQNSGLIRLDSLRYTAHHESIKRCYNKCRDYSSSQKTGCEVIFNNQHNQGCYIHTLAIHPDRGDGSSHGYCWVGTMP